MFLGQEVHYYMVFMAYYTELNLQICNYVQKQRICRENSKYMRLTKIVVGIFALAEKLPTSATLLPLKNKFPRRRMKKDSGTAKHEENTAKEKVAKERESESESRIVTWCKGIVGISLFKVKKVIQLYSYLQIDMSLSQMLGKFEYGLPAKF